MSARKTSLTDKQTKNGTSKYVLERCASVNEYYDIAFKVCIPVLSCVLFLCFALFVVQLEEHMSYFTVGSAQLGVPASIMNIDHILFTRLLVKQTLFTVCTLRTELTPSHKPDAFICIKPL